MSIFITHGNRLIDFANPQNSDIHIDDIIHHLAMIPRFGGKLDVHYSVLDHSVFAGTIAKTCLKVDDMTAFAVLMHDAQEAFLGDVTSPLKQLLPDYKKIEKAFEMVIRDKFKIRIKAEMEIVVKTADILALKAEKQAFIQTPAELAEHWRFLDKFPTVPISPREYINSKALFKDAFNYYNKALNLGHKEI
ncbi:phosphohydrolase [Haemophilus parainfluenzae]|uniref:phosphohydrolase n=1 Tax=Haemophilus parainfluenzae TaxID=729 RepID=UPI000DADE852|nr:phosphohydrolase [Haemophilus parainfluenzae]RDE78339.1 phosphohydrolase [Haemophilus parainfluenzae]